MYVVGDAANVGSDTGSIRHEEALIAAAVLNQCEVTGTTVRVPRNSSSCIG